MRTLATFFLIGLFAIPVAAQAQGSGARNQGIPPGQMPPAGSCRVWYEGRSPGQQPRATNCDQAERIASRDRNARVIYGGAPGQRGDDRWDRDDNRNDRQRVFGNQRIALDTGARDGYQKGRDDARGNDGYDPVRHSWYRSGTRGYENRYGSKEQYRNVYREGFERGYAQGYRENADRDELRRAGIRR